jgi:hypothetical protein
MKRSERFLMRARRTALWAVVVFSAVCAGCVWAVVATMPAASGGVLAGLIATTGLYACGTMLREAWRLWRMSEREAVWEWRSEVRPRL